MNRPTVISALRNLIIVIVAVYAGGVIYTNRMRSEAVLEPIGGGAPMGALEDASINVMTWNIGYGGLGAESDFSADGGKHYLPPSREIVDKNLAGIVAELKTATADMIILQETARPGAMTRGADILGAVGAALAGRDNAFSADLTMRVLPPMLRFRHGLFSSANVAGIERETIPLPLEPQHILGLARRLYHMHVTRIPFSISDSGGVSGGEWTIVNVHLSAFDEGADVRLAQLRAVVDYAEQEYSAGNHVIIGGDWNYEFHRPDWPATTEEQYLFWLHPFPFEELPRGWRAGYDRKVPTVRTNERPYRRGENFTTVIDGFVVSPNVEIDSVETTDLDFQITDHQPVTARFTAKD